MEYASTSTETDAFLVGRIGWIDRITTLWICEDGLRERRMSFVLGSGLVDGDVRVLAGVVLGGVHWIVVFRRSRAISGSMRFNEFAHDEVQSDKELDAIIATDTEANDDAMMSSLRFVRSIVWLRSDYQNNLLALSCTISQRLWERWRFVDWELMELVESKYRAALTEFIALSPVGAERNDVASAVPKQTLLSFHFYLAMSAYKLCTYNFELIRVLLICLQEQLGSTNLFDNSKELPGL
jgi:hypothetical protein